MLYNQSTVNTTAVDPSAGCNTPLTAYYNSAILNKGTVYVVMNGVALVEVTRDTYTLSDFDFSPNTAPTFDQLYSDYALHSVLIASGGDKPFIDSQFN